MTGVNLNFLINKLSASEISNQSCSSKIAAVLFFCITSPIFVLVYKSVLQSSFFFDSYFLIRNQFPSSMYLIIIIIIIIIIIRRRRRRRRRRKRRIRIIIKALFILHDESAYSWC